MANQSAPSYVITLENGLTISGNDLQVLLELLLQLLEEIETIDEHQLCFDF